MKRKKRITSALMIVVTLIIMLLPVSGADAETSASDFKMEGSTLVKYRGTEKNVTIPSTVEVIGRSAFEDNTNIELVVVPNSVKRIEPYAFWGCNSLDTVVLGRGLSEVGDYSFAGCKGLVQMSIPSTVSSIGIQAFADCVNLKDISIPPETQYIHETSFDGCARLTIHCETGSAADQYAQDFYERQKEMPEYEDVPNYQPSDPNQGTETPQPTPVPDPAPTQTPVEVPGNLLGSTQIVGNKAVVFINNTQLPVYGSDNRQEPGAEETPSSEGQTSNAEFGDSIPKFRIVDGKTVADQACYRSSDLGDVVIPDGIEEIGQFAFARSSLTSVVLPEGTEKISYGAFYHCDHLVEATLPDTIMCVEPKAFDHTLWVEDFLNGGVGQGSPDTAGAGDFLIAGGVLIAYRGTGTDVQIPSGVRVIAGEVFLDHTEIEKVTLPDSLQVIGEGAFEGCSSLAGLEFGRSVAEIKDRAFLGNILREVVLPASVKKVGLQAFGNAIVTYSSGEPEHIHEDSAERLSNAAYRVYVRTEEQTPGVTTEGWEETFGSGIGTLSENAAFLEGADRAYTLTIRQAEDPSAMEKAYQRALQRSLPENSFIYELTFTDESGIPLRKLGHQMLTVTLPVSEELRGQKLQVIMLDRNGQLEAVPAENVVVDGVEALQFQLSYVSTVGVYGVRE